MKTYTVFLQKGNNPDFNIFVKASSSDKAERKALVEYPDHSVIGVL